MIQRQNALLLIYSLINSEMITKKTNFSSSFCRETKVTAHRYQLHSPPLQLRPRLWHWRYYRCCGDQNCVCVCVCVCACWLLNVGQEALQSCWHSTHTHTHTHTQMDSVCVYNSCIRIDLHERTHSTRISSKRWFHSRRAVRVCVCACVCVCVGVCVCVLPETVRWRWRCGWRAPSPRLSGRRGKLCGGLCFLSDF